EILVGAALREREGVRPGHPVRPGRPDARARAAAAAVSLGVYVAVGATAASGARARVRAVLEVPLPDPLDGVADVDRRDAVAADVVDEVGPAPSHVHDPGLRRAGLRRRIRG